MLGDQIQTLLFLFNDIFHFPGLTIDSIFIGRFCSSVMTGIMQPLLSRSVLQRFSQEQLRNFFFVFCFFKDVSPFTSKDFFFEKRKDDAKTSQSRELKYQEVQLPSTSTTSTAEDLRCLASLQSDESTSRTQRGLHAVVLLHLVAGDKLKRQI